MSVEDDLRAAGWEKEDMPYNWRGGYFWSSPAGMLYDEKCNFDGVEWDFWPMEGQSMRSKPGEHPLVLVARALLTGDSR
jgi:hypothetical protein